jgi:hypothetical protein
VLQVSVHDVPTHASLIASARWLWSDAAPVTAAALATTHSQPTGVQPTALDGFAIAQLNKCCNVMVLHWRDSYVQSQ